MDSYGTEAGARVAATPRIYIIMGVCGCGKTTVGRLLATRIGAQFVDADDFHPPGNRVKLGSGIPLTDEDRWPWYARLRTLIDANLASGGSIVLACSALKETYRRVLDPNYDPAVRFIWLAGSYELIAERMAARQGHFMPASLLQSQFATLEPPPYALRVEVGPVPERIVEQIVSQP
ncbi:MAG: gluconokinase [Verrucomicrobiota bacterium]|nr:gluconokinase [Verrucomicrobiota bacterium]